MTESNKHKHARRRAPARLAGKRTWVLAALAVAGLALVVRLVLGGHSGADEQTPVGAALTTVGNTWKSEAGDSYRLTVTPLTDPVNAGSNDGCVPAPGDGRTNLRFTVRIDNEGSEPAPVPRLDFGVNVNSAGVVGKGLSYAKASKTISLSPQRNARDCADSSRVNGGDDEIAPSSAAIYTGLIGGIRTPVGAGLALIVRYEHADAGASSGSSTKELLARFPAVAR